MEVSTVNQVPETPFFFCWRGSGQVRVLLWSFLGGIMGIFGVRLESIDCMMIFGL